MHRRELLDEIDYTPSIYRTFERGGRLHRHNAPDCAMRVHLLQHGARELRAKPPAFSVLTRHYSDNGTYGLYHAGKMSRHLDAHHVLGFDPKLCSMAMEVESCTALVEYCRRFGPATALDLGTGAGNSYHCLRAAGVTQVTSVDECGDWTTSAMQLAKEGGDHITAFLTRPITSVGSVRTYDLRDLGSRRFDLVVIDGPQQSPSGRLAAASQVTASHYAFHDANRDQEMIAAFVRQLRERGHQPRTTETSAGRGMAFVSVEAA
jgi:hypothetical protein